MVAVKALNQAQITLRTVSTHAASVSTNTVAGKTRVLSSTATPTPVCDTTTTPSSPKKVSWLSALFGDSGSSQPKVHRPFGVHEKAHLKLATRKKDKVMQTNPGARVEPEFLPEIESHRLVEEALDVIKKYGISHVSEEQRIEMAHQLKHFPLPKADLKELVNMQRVTGRFEDAAQTLAPWGYGDDFNIEQVPPALRSMLERIQASPHFCLGKPRDITLNHRENYFYRLDPHIDPVDDGGNVFILGLLSGTVLTLSPTSRTMHPDQHKAMDPRRVAEVSWLPGKDIDVDLPARTLLHLSGDARYSWCHGIRLGVTHPQIEDYYLGAELPEEARVLGGEQKGEVPLWDWWGNMKNLRRRGPERLSIIFAFSDPE